jgi:hypothetical protein
MLQMDVVEIGQNRFFGRQVHRSIVVRPFESLHLLLMARGARLPTDVTRGFRQLCAVDANATQPPAQDGKNPKPQQRNDGCDRSPPAAGRSRFSPSVFVVGHLDRFLVEAWNKIANPCDRRLFRNGVPKLSCPQGTLVSRFSGGNLARSMRCILC